MSEDIIIDVKNIWKRYGLPPLLPWKKRVEDENDYALKDISFQVRRGGSLGILGRNGAGKSTLLKLLAGVTPPDKGSIEVRGKIFSMIELSAGISNELTGRENVQLLATVMGFTPEEIKEVEPAVEEFSELDSWLDKPVWQYSSGMLARLAFGIAVNAKADILLVDEVLSTGDIMFQKKCQQHVQKLLSGGVTLIFVSHNPYQVEKLCEHGMLLENGRCAEFDSAHIIMREYMHRAMKQNMNLGNRLQQNTDLRATANDRPGTGDVRATKIVLRNSMGEEAFEIVAGEAISFTVEYEALEQVERIILNITIFDMSGVPLTVLTPAQNDQTLLTIQKGKGSFVCYIPSFLLIGMGLYCSIKISSTYILDSIENAFIFSSMPNKDISRRVPNGAIFIDSNWEYNVL